MILQRPVSAGADSGMHYESTHFPPFFFSSSKYLLGEANDYPTLEMT